jgi:Flp pilus assembly protein TadD
VVALRRGLAPGLPFLFFLLTLGPVSNVIPSSTPMAERYLYLPSVALSMLVACLPGTARWRKAGRGAEPARTGMDGTRHDGAAARVLSVLVAAALGLGLLGYAAESWRRTTLWRDDLTLFRWAVECAPANPSAWNNLAKAQLEAGDPEAARRSAGVSLRLSPGYAEAWANLGRSLEVLHSDAIETYREGIARSGGSLDTLWVNLSGALLRAGRAGEAELAARTGLERHRGTAELWGNLGQSLLSQGRATEAREALREALELQPRHPELWATLAEIELRRGERAAAIAALEAAVRQVRPSARAHHNLGVLLETTQPRRAAQHLRRYLALEPRAADAAAVRARIGRLEQAAGEPPQRDGL